MKNLLRLSVCLVALNLYVQATPLEEESITSSTTALNKLLDQHLNKPLTLSDITTIRRTLAEHIINITQARKVAQDGWARLYLDSLADPTQVYYVSQETVRKILDLDNNGRFNVHVPIEGSGSVPTHRTAHFGGVYFKQDGHASISPGMEYAMYSFYGLLVGQILAPSCLMIMRDVESPYSKSFFVQASQLIPGLTLEQALQQGQIPVLNSDNLSRFLTGSWLTNPSDYKPDNMIVLPKGNQNYLLGIDDDLALNDPIVRGNHNSFQHVLGIKQILYCIPQYMGTVFSEQLRHELLAINPSLKILEWLQALAAQNERYERLKQGRILYPGDYPVLGLPIRLIPGIAGHIEEQLHYLQAIVHDHSGLTHEQVWQKLQPVPHLVYKSIRQQRNTPLDCLGLIYARSDQPLESYLPLNTYLEGSGQRSKGTKRRLYQHLRHYQALASDHVTQLSEEIKAAATLLVNHISIDRFSRAERLSLYQFIADTFPEALLNSQNPAWRQQELLQELYRQTELTDSHVALLLQLGLDLTKVTDTSQETELHRLVKGGRPYHHHIRALVQQGQVKIDAVSHMGLTALDEALALHDAATVKLLLELGAGQQVKLTRLMPFYQQHADEEEWQPLFRNLRKRNQEFAWQSGLWQLLPPLSNQQNIDKDRLLSLASLKPARRFIASGIKVERITQEGRRAVAKIEWERQGEPQSVYLKFYPELPGFEAAISLLMNRYLFGFGAPYGELGMIGDATPCYISQGIEGGSLLATLQQHPERLKELDAYSLSALFVGTMLIAPEDGKPDNYIVEPLANGKYRLIAIDNDHALADPLAQEMIANRVKCCPQVKTILYCMDQMQDPIHADVKAKILATDFKALLERWLTMLNGIQQEYSALFNNQQHLQNLYLNEQYPCFIGIPFKTEMIAKLYDRCIRIQAFLSQQGDKLPKHYAILKAVEPVLAERYNIKPFQHLPLLGRFEKIDGKYFQKSQSGHFMTTTNLDILLAGLHLDVQKVPQKKDLIEAVRLSNNIGPAQALMELQAEHKALANQDCSLQQFKTLKTEEARAAFLEELVPTAVSLQDTWLQEIQNQPCRHLTLSSFNRLQDLHILRRLDLRNLNYLNVRGCQLLSNYLVGQLAQNSPNLTFLDASQTVLTEFSYTGRLKSSVITFPRLKVLKLEECKKLRDIKLASPKLLQLSLANCVQLRFIEGGFPKLTRLDLSNVSRLPQSIFDQIFSQLAQFKVINLTGCLQLLYADLITKYPGYSFQVYKFVNQLPNNKQEFLQRLLKDDKEMQQLSLRYNQIDDGGGQALAEALKVNSTLQKLDLLGNQIDDGGGQALAEALKVNSTLQKLILLGNQIGANGAKGLAEALKVNSTLQQLKLGGSQIGDAGARDLAEALKMNSSLQQLDLGGSQIGADGAKGLAEALKMNSSLQQLDLGGSQIGDAGARDLADALKLNSSLQQLDLFNNRIGADGAKGLAEALKVNSTLQQLDVKYNQIGATGAQALAEVLKVNSTLQKLNLENNQIGAAGGQALAEALKVNSTLQKLDLRYNQIGEGGGQALAEALKVNSTLQKLSLWDNQIGDAGARDLAEALKVNSTLQRLDLWQNEIGAVGGQTFAEALKVNSTLQQLNLRGNRINGALTSQINELLEGRKSTLATASTIVLAAEEIAEQMLLTQLLEPSYVPQDMVEESPVLTRVSAEPWSYSVLSIDGGGIRGYIPALILKKLQDYAGNAHPLHTLFDYIGGTSVGGILSLGLTVPNVDNDSWSRYHISDLVQLFRQKGHRIFPQDMKVVKKIKQFFRVKYNEQPLENLLQEYFGDAHLSSALTPTLITTWLNHYGSERRFEGFAFTSVAAQKDELDDYRMWEVARCTSAAPTYFKGYRIKNIHSKIHSLLASSEQSLNPYRLYSLENNQTWLHDGGLWYNNPTKLTYRALQTYTAQNTVPVTASNCIVVSLGTGQSPTVNLKPTAGIVGAIEPLIENGFYQKDMEIEEYCHRHFGSNYYRLQPILQREITLDDTSPANIEALHDAAATLFPGETIEMLARRLTENKANRHPAQL